MERGIVPGESCVSLQLCLVWGPWNQPLLHRTACPRLGKEESPPLNLPSSIPAGLPSLSTISGSKQPLGREAPPPLTWMSWSKLLPQAPLASFPPLVVIIPTPQVLL